MGRIEMIEPQTNRRDLVGDTGKLLSLAAVLLPASGVLVRVVFFSQYLNSAGELAVRAPLSELIMTGLLALSQAGAFVVTLVLFQLAGPFLYLARRKAPILNEMQNAERFRHWLESSGERDQALSAAIQLDIQRLRQDLESLQREWEAQFPGRTKIFNLGSATLSRTIDRMMTYHAAHPARGFIVAALVIALFLPGWPVVWIPLLISTLVAIRASTVVIQTGRLEITRLWWVIVTAMIFLSVQAGLSYGPPIGVYPQNVVFRSGSAGPGIPSGVYERLGETGSSVFIAKCNGGGREWMEIDSSAIARLDGPIGAYQSNSAFTGQSLVSSIVTRTIPDFNAPKLCEARIR